MFRNQSPNLKSTTLIPKQPNYGFAVGAVYVDCPTADPQTLRITCLTRNISLTGRVHYSYMIDIMIMIMMQARKGILRMLLKCPTPWKGILKGNFMFCPSGTKFYYYLAARTCAGCSHITYHICMYRTFFYEVGWGRAVRN